MTRSSTRSIKIRLTLVHAVLHQLVLVGHLPPRQLVERRVQPHHFLDELLPTALSSLGKLLQARTQQEAQAPQRYHREAHVAANQLLVRDVASLPRPAEVEDLLRVLSQSVHQGRSFQSVVHITEKRIEDPLGQFLLLQLGDLQVVPVVKLADDDDLVLDQVVDVVRDVTLEEHRMNHANYYPPVHLRNRVRVVLLQDVREVSHFFVDHRFHVVVELC